MSDDDHRLAKRWVEEHFPGATGTIKGILILTYGAGLDRGMEEAQRLLEAELETLRTNSPDR